MENYDNDNDHAGGVNADENINGKDDNGIIIEHLE